MRLEELLLTQEEQEQHQQDKMDRLKTAIEKGRAPEIHNASAVMGSWAWGDLKKLGLAHKDVGRRSRHERQERWVYSPDAPGPITLIKRVNGKQESVVFQPGDATDWIDVDYS